MSQTKKSLQDLTLLDRFLFAEVMEDAETFENLDLRIGYFMGHRFYINDELLEIDPSEYNGGSETLKITQVK